MHELLNFKQGIALRWAQLVLLTGCLVSCGTENAAAPNACVDGRRAINIPADHAAHNDFANEWWYYAGVVEDETGAEYAFHVAFFKHWATGEKRMGIPVRWFGNPAQFAQGALTELGTGQRYAREVIGSRRLGTAGARLDHLSVWTGKWNTYAQANGTPRICADLGEANLDLRLVPEKPWTVHGKRGEMPASRSYYMSSTRMSVQGTLKLNGSTRMVTGAAWADHEMMGPDVARGADGWDWFALQMDDGSEIVHYYSRYIDGSASKRSMTAWIDKKGVRRALAHGECRVTPTAHWVSPKSGVRYPVSWSLKIPKWGIDYSLSSAFKDGELYGRYSQVRYWEGVVKVTGKRNGRPVSGRGYVELAGYDRPLRGF